MICIFPTVVYGRELQEVLNNPAQEEIYRLIPFPQTESMEKRNLRCGNERK